MNEEVVVDLSNSNWKKFIHLPTDWTCSSYYGIIMGGVEKCVGSGASKSKLLLTLTNCPNDVQPFLDKLPYGKPMSIVYSKAVPYPAAFRDSELRARMSVALRSALDHEILSSRVILDRAAQLTRGVIVDEQHIVVEAPPPAVKVLCAQTITRVEYNPDRIRSGTSAIKVTTTTKWQPPPSGSTGLGNGPGTIDPRKSDISISCVRGQSLDELEITRVLYSLGIFSEVKTTADSVTYILPVDDERAVAYRYSKQSVHENQVLEYVGHYGYIRLKWKTNISVGVVAGREYISKHTFEFEDISRIWLHDGVIYHKHFDEVSVLATWTDSAWIFGAKRDVNYIDELSAYKQMDSALKNQIVRLIRLRAGECIFYGAAMSLEQVVESAAKVVAATSTSEQVYFKLPDVMAVDVRGIRRTPWD